MKKCNSCHELNKEYYKDLSKKDGFCTICKDCKKKYYNKNIDNIKNYNHSRWKNYYLKNKKKINKQRCLRQKQRRKEDIEFKIKCYLRSRLYNALKNNYKVGSSIKSLGCKISELKIYLEKQFQEGMTWENYGKWHIDHIKPLSIFDLTNHKELLEACHYSNLQPLWEYDNLIKSSKVTK